MSYQGWANYPTWAVVLWIGNEEGSYRYWREQAMEALEDANDDRQEAANTLAGQLKDQFNDEAPVVDESSVWSDLLSYALDEVDWYEVAEAQFEE